MSYGKPLFPPCVEAPASTSIFRTPCFLSSRATRELLKWFGRSAVENNVQVERKQDMVTVAKFGHLTRLTTTRAYKMFSLRCRFATGRLRPRDGHQPSRRLELHEVRTQADARAICRKEKEIAYALIRLSQKVMNGIWPGRSLAIRPDYDPDQKERQFACLLALERDLCRCLEYAWITRGCIDPEYCGTAVEVKHCRS